MRQGAAAGTGLNAEKVAPEASKFLAPELAEKIEPPAPAPAKAEEPRSAQDSTVQPPPPAPEPRVQPPPQDAELEALKKAIAESQAKDAQNGPISTPSNYGNWNTT